VKWPVGVLAIGLFVLGGLLPAEAHQPVMDMAPRWEGGYGFQVRHESRSSETLKDGDSEVDNPFGRMRRVNTIWWEGIYTFKREVRVTAKLPWVDQSRTIVRGDRAVRQAGTGWGDLILGVPLKHYQNLETYTWNAALTPSLRIPTGSTSDDFPVGDGSWDPGLSLSYTREGKMYFFSDLFYWFNTRGKRGIAEGDELGLDVNAGFNAFHNKATNTGTFFMWTLHARYQDRGVDGEGISGGTRLSTGPVFVWYRNNLMLRAEYEIPAYEKFDGPRVSRGSEVRVGIGMTF
jgi:hypothetical protein